MKHACEDNEFPDELAGGPASPDHDLDPTLFDLETDEWDEEVEVTE